MDGISRETFKEIKDPNIKLDIVFDYLSDQHEICKKCAEKTDHTGKVNMVVAGAMGFVGGLMGFLGKAILGR
jgi:hypothetical protein